MCRCRSRRQSRASPRCGHWRRIGWPSHSRICATAPTHTPPRARGRACSSPTSDEIAEHNRRSTWAWNLLAAGGIEGLTSDGYKNAAEAAAAFKKSGARVACICSSDAVYAAQAKDTAKALKVAGASRVLLAGKPGEDEAALRAAGVDGFLQAGQDAIAALKELQKSLGIA